MGAVLAKAFHDQAKQTILVLCNTTDALDDFLQHLLDLGVPAHSIASLTRKTRRRGAPRPPSARTPLPWPHSPTQVDQRVVTDASDALRRLRNAFEGFDGATGSPRELLAHLEFAAPEFHYAFTVPDAADSDSSDDEDSVDSTYLITRWLRGCDAGPHKDAPHVRATAAVWDMPRAKRQERVQEWRDAIVRELAERVVEEGEAFNACQRSMGCAVAGAALDGRRVIACTTADVAAYSGLLRDAALDTVIVEEAEKMLESEVLAVLGEKTERLVLLGDHT